MPTSTKDDQGITTPLQTSYFGIMIGVLIVVLIMIIGGLYLWQQSLEESAKIIQVPEVTRPTAVQNNEPESTNAEADVETLQAMSTGDDIDLIQADLESTQIQDLGTDLQTIDSEIAPQP